MLRAKTITLLEENKRVNLRDFELGNKLLARTKRYEQQEKK